MSGDKEFDAALDALSDALAELGEVLADYDELVSWPPSLSTARRVKALTEKVENLRVELATLLEDDGDDVEAEEDGV